MGQGAFSSQPRLHPFSPAAARPPRLTQGGSVRLYAPLSLLLAAHSSTAAALGCHGNVMQAGRGGGGLGRPLVTSALLAVHLSRPPSSFLFWKRAAALLLMLSRGRLFKATGGVAAPPEPGSCPRPRIASPAQGLGPGRSPRHPPHPHPSAPRHCGDLSTMEKGGPVLGPRPSPQQGRLSCTNLGRKQDARLSVLGDPLDKATEGQRQVRTSLPSGLPSAPCLCVFLLGLSLEPV
jgi:hypothetical protein